MARFASDALPASQAPRPDEVMRDEDRRLLWRAPLALHLVDIATVIQDASDGWLDLLGYQKADVLGRRITDFMTEESSANHLRDGWPKLLRHGNLAEHCEFRHRDGSILQIALSCIVERDEWGAVRCALGGLVDITAQHQAEQASRQAQKMEAVGQLTGGVAHDFNNILSVILGALDMAQSRTHDPDLCRLLETAQQAAQRGAQLTGRMLAFSRQEDLPAQNVDVVAAISGLHDMLQRMIGPMLRIDYDLRADTWNVTTDSVQLEVALINLAVNARDAMPDGGKLSISCCNRMHAPGLPSGAFVAIAVRDTGQGMPDSVRSEALKPFFTTKAEGKGTGLGLAMVHGFAQRSGGTVTIDSTPGQGTCVTIFLPRGSIVPDAKAATIIANATRRLRVLLVDDDVAVRSVLRDMLEEAGHSVTDLDDGDAALAQLRREKFDLLISDFAMPEMDGLRLSALAEDLAPQMRIIIMTGYADGENLRDWSGPGREILHKPFSSTELSAAMNRAIESTQSH